MKKTISVCILFVLIISFIGSAYAVDSWDCPNPECGRKGNMGNYCGGCGYPAPWLETTPDPFTPTSSPTPTNTPTPAPTPRIQGFKTVGNIVTFGTYPQTKEGKDQTPIEWIVLDYDEENHKALLISKNGLDVKPYNTGHRVVAWKTCTLRKWMNNDFMNNAFTAEEQSVILTTEVDNSKSQGYSDWNTGDEKNTQDQLFLLSYAEANRYLGVTYAYRSEATKSRVAPTDYAITQGVYVIGSYQTLDAKPAVCWWLRSPGHSRYSAALVEGGGRIRSDRVNSAGYVVRPALWLNLESDIF